MVDEFVMNRLGEVSGFKLLNVESKEAIEALDKIPATEGTQSQLHSLEHLDESECTDLLAWLQKELGTKVGKATISSQRLTKASSSPAVIVNHQPGSTRRLMELLSKRSGGVPFPTDVEDVELNPYHPIIHGLSRMRTTNPQLATQVAEQVPSVYIAFIAPPHPLTLLLRSMTMPVSQPELCQTPDPC
jgi:HSP90 family molecular chaperone